jgi:hypothetical protein
MPLVSTACVVCEQEHGTILPMLVGGKTAQPAALTPLGIINEGLEQLEKLTAANFKGGVFQGGSSPTGFAMPGMHVELLSTQHYGRTFMPSLGLDWRAAYCDPGTPRAVLAAYGLPRHDLHHSTVTVSCMPVVQPDPVHLPTASLLTDGDGASVAKSRRKLAAVVCKRLQDLLACLKVLVGTVIAMPVVIDQQVRPAYCCGVLRKALGCIRHGLDAATLRKASPLHGHKGHAVVAKSAVTTQQPAQV